MPVTYTPADREARRRPWRFVVTDLAGGTQIGEPLAFERRVSFGVSKPATASFRIRSDDPLWPQIAAGDSGLKVYDGQNTLRFFGPLITDEEEAAGATARVRCTAVDVFWRLTKRYVVKDPSGKGVTITYHPALIVDAILDNAVYGINVEQDTHIHWNPTSDLFVPTQITYLWKRASDAIAELGGIIGSYEWFLSYTDTTTPGEWVEAELNLVPTMGLDRTDEVFLEYGCGKLNCSSYSRVRSLEAMANRVYVLGNGATNIASSYDSASMDRYGLMEDVISYPDIAANNLLDSLAHSHIAVRKAPREIVSLKPYPKRVPRYGLEYTVGDRIRARVEIEGVARVAGAVRIWGVDIAIDELGNELPTFRLVPE